MVKGETLLPKASGRYQSSVWRRKKWAHFLLDERQKINSATCNTTNSSLRMNFPNFRFFAVYWNPLPRVRSTCRTLEEIGINIWFLPTSVCWRNHISLPKHTFMLFQGMQVHYNELQRGAPLGLRLFPSSWNYRCPDLLFVTRLRLW